MLKHRSHTAFGGKTGLNPMPHYDWQSIHWERVAYAILSLPAIFMLYDSMHVADPLSITNILRVGTAIAALIAIAGVAYLYKISRHGVQEVVRQRSIQLGQIAAGLAHEIRNPLHALRINLHALRRSQTSKVQLTPADLAATIDESDREIDRLEVLMRDFLSFAIPGREERSEVNLPGELQATLNLMHEDMVHKQIEVKTQLSPQPIAVSVDQGRLRQVLLNLLTFAQHHAGPNGQIEVSLSRSNGQAEIVIADNGPTLSESQRGHIFEPFQASRETGSGLGLALVGMFAEKSGGRAECQANHPVGNRFRLVLPPSVSTRRAKS